MFSPTNTPVGRVPPRGAQGAGGDMISQSMSLCLTAMLLCCTAANKPAITESSPTFPAAAAWTNSPFADSNYFPIAVWLQDPKNVARYQAAGINLYVGLWKGPTESQLATLRAARMPVICEQNELGLAQKGDPIIAGWMHSDEPDNAQPIIDPKTLRRSWGGPVPPSQVVERYEETRRADASRPVLLNLGQGVANDQWMGRGSGARLDDYLTYVKGADIVSFDVYPVAGLEKTNGENHLWYVAKGIDRLAQWSGGRKIIWNCIEASPISGDKKPSPEQIRAEVWMSLVHGSRGLIYFVHQFKPQFNESFLLSDPALLSGVAAINRQIHELAPVLNSAGITNLATVQSSTADTPIDFIGKQYRNDFYLFSVGMRNRATHGRFKLIHPGALKSVEVLGENRRILLRAGKFEDDFKPYEVHLYRFQ